MRVGIHPEVMSVLSVMSGQGGSVFCQVREVLLCGAGSEGKEGEDGRWDVCNAGQ